MTAGRQARAVAAPLLHYRMLRHVLVPMLLTWFCASAVMLLIANNFVGRAQDRMLLDDATALSGSIEPGAHGVRVLPGVHERALAESPPQLSGGDEVVYAVLSASGAVLAGTSMPLLRLPEGGRSHRYSYIMRGGQRYRVLVLRHESQGRSAYVVTAQSTAERYMVMRRLLWLACLPALLMFIPVSLWSWRRIKDDLYPLSQLNAVLLARDEGDASPLRIATSTREIARIVKTFNDLLERVGHQSAMQREFAGNVAHELRTPLAGIRALAEFGLASGSREVMQEQLSRIVTSTERAGRLVNQLLDLALLEEDQVALHLVDIDPADFVRQTVLRHLDKADQQGVDLGARGLEEAEAAGVCVRADTALLTGLLDNLIDNALRYGGSTVTVALDTDSTHCTITVEDDGPGIPAEQRTAMMLRGSQGGEGERLGQGAGLGLFLVGRYARLLGARLLLNEVEVGGGLRASVILPRTPHG